METRARRSIAPERLLDFAAAVYARAGMPEADARLAADTLVQADLWGHQSHGVMRLSWYVARLRAGVCVPVAKPELVVDADAFAAHKASAQFARWRDIAERVLVPGSQVNTTGELLVTHTAEETA